MPNTEIKRVTLHPLKSDGALDPNVCLYPKTLIDGVVDRDGQQVEVATQTELNAVADAAAQEISRLANEKQDALIDGETIKTLDGSSLLGSGDIALKTINGEKICEEGDLRVVTCDTEQYIDGEKTFKTAINLEQWPTERAHAANKGYVDESKLTKITYSELKAIRDSAELIPGAFYRITDYECTTTQFDTRSAGNRFDIIVQALDETTLSENASAIKHAAELTPVIYYRKSEDSSDQDYLTFLGDFSYNDAICGRWERHDSNNPDTQNFYLILNARVVNGEIDTPLSEIKLLAAQLVDSEDKFYNTSVSRYKDITFDRTAKLPLGDYFKDSDLSAWQLKYCLDNDTSRFAWANSLANDSIYTDDDLSFEYKGTIDINGTTYYLWYNENFGGGGNGGDAGYLASTSRYLSEYSSCSTISIENKTIVDKDYSSVISFTYAGKGVIYWMKDEFNNECPYDFKNIQFKRYAAIQVDDVLQNIFDYYEEIPSYIATNGDNVPHIEEFSENDFKWLYTFTTNDYKDSSLNAENLANIGGGYYALYCYDNHIKELMQPQNIDEANIRTVQTLNNIVISAIDAAPSEAGADGGYPKMYSNSFDFCCHNITVAGHFYSNKLGSSNHTCLFFKCCCNTFGNECGSNTFGNGCGSNTFGNDCCLNTFGNSCSSNTFGNYCNSNTLLDSASNNESKAYARCNIFDNGVQYVTLNGSGTGSANNYLQNIHICQGVCGTYKLRKTITEMRNLSHDVTYRAEGAEDKTI